MRPIRYLLLTTCLIQVLLPNILSACPTCKAGLHHDGTATAYAGSILLMMSMPFVILSVWVTTIVRLRASKPHWDPVNLDE